MLYVCSLVLFVRRTKQRDYKEWIKDERRSMSFNCVPSSISFGGVELSCSLLSLYINSMKWGDFIALKYPHQQIECSHAYKAY